MCAACPRSPARGSGARCTSGARRAASCRDRVDGCNEARPAPARITSMGSRIGIRKRSCGKNTSAAHDGRRGEQPQSRLRRLAPGSDERHDRQGQDGEVRHDRQQHGSGSSARCTKVRPGPRGRRACETRARSRRLDSLGSTPWPRGSRSVPFALHSALGAAARSRWLSILIGGFAAMSPSPTASGWLPVQNVHAALRGHEHEPAVLNVVARCPWADGDHDARRQVPPTVAKRRRDPRTTAAIGRKSTAPAESERRSRAPRRRRAPARSGLVRRRRDRTATR